MSVQLQDFGVVTRDRLYINAVERGVLVVPYGRWLDDLVLLGLILSRLPGSRLADRMVSAPRGALLPR